MMTLNLSHFYHEEEALQRGEALLNFSRVMKQLTGENDVKFELDQCIARDYTYVLRYTTSNNDNMYMSVSCSDGLFTFYKNESLIFEVGLVF
jgi:hypothetical protein